MTPQQRAERACSHWVKSSAGPGLRRIGEALDPYYDRVARAARPRDPVWSPVGEAFIVGVSVGVLVMLWLS